MKKTMTILRYIYAVILILFGLMTTYQMISEGYNPNNKDLFLFNDTFRNLHDAIMISYLGYVVRIAQLICGILLFTKRYWWIALLCYLPFSVNIFLIHIVHDMPPAHFGFFLSGIVVAIINFVLVIYEKKRLKTLIVKPEKKLI